MSVWDELAKELVQPMRDLQDLKVDILGTSTQVLRVSLSTPDARGFSTETYEDNLIDNVIIKYPINQIEMFDNTDNSTADVTSINLMEVLPIEMFVKFKAEDGNDIVDLEDNDIIVDVFFDDKGNKLPMIFQIKKLVGSAKNKYIVSKHYELSLYRGKLPSETQSYINSYIATVVG